MILLYSAVCFLVEAVLQLLPSLRARGHWTEGDVSCVKLGFITKVGQDLMNSSDRAAFHCSVLTGELFIYPLINFILLFAL